MGLDRTGANFLCFAKQRGVNFARTATIGRQQIYADPKFVEGMTGYAEPFFRLLGADTIESFDKSAYEGASQLHDLNNPIPTFWHRTFTSVVDLGSLEHIFNYPQALKNCMDMVEIGGHFIAVSPGNNWSGHGFYQIQPELFYRAFCPENGFMSEYIGIVSDDVMIPVPDTFRFSFDGRKQTSVVVLARKFEHIEPFRNYPQESFYTAEWTKSLDKGRQT